MLTLNTVCLKVVLNLLDDEEVLLWVDGVVSLVLVCGVVLLLSSVVLMSIAMWSALVVVRLLHLIGELTSPLLCYNGTKHMYID